METTEVLQGLEEMAGEDLEDQMDLVEMVALED